MLRATFCALAVAAAAPFARAGELDREPAPATGAPAIVSGGSELDRESPQPAHGWRWGGPTYYGGWGWGGFYPARVSYFGVGFGSPYFYRPLGFYGGFYNFGYAYRPFFPTYYYPSTYGWWW